MMAGARLVDRYRGLICDLDGVIYRGLEAVPHAVEALTLRGKTTRLVLATNNASRSAAEVAGQVTGLGLEVTPAQVVTSAEAGAAHLSSILEPGATVLAVGGSGVVEALAAAGLRPVRTASGVRAVLQGYGRNVTAGDLAEASYAVAAGATWVAANRDATLPTEHGTAPGNGTLVDAVAVATGRKPLVVGKPEAPLYTLGVERLRTTPDEVLAVGDRLDTDILGAVNAGLDSLWVLTGVDDLASFVTSDVRALPTFVGLDLRALLRPAPRVTREAGWWVCGGLRLRLDLTRGNQDLLQVVADGAPQTREHYRDAALSAGFRALARAREAPDSDDDRLGDAAIELASRLA